MLFEYHQLSIIDLHEMHSKTLFLVNLLPLLIGVVALPLEERQEPTRTYWIHPGCRALGDDEAFVQSIKESIWTASRIADSLHAFDGQLSDPGKAAAFFVLQTSSSY